MKRRFLYHFILFGCAAVVSAEALASERENRALLQRYAPVWVQEIGRQPLYDVITSFDFDGNSNGNDNVRNASRFPLLAHVYGEVIAETSDATYLFYGVYHIRDYDTPLREFFFPSSSHDNDFEGAMVVVSKADASVLAVETWFHSIFLQFARYPYSKGTQSIDGKIHLEERTHPILFVDCKGHGVRAFQKIDEERLGKNPHTIYRLGSRPSDLSRNRGPFASYSLVTIDAFLRFAKGPFTKTAMFSEAGSFGLPGGDLGKYLSGEFSGDSLWARPKPPWSWTDKFDTLRPGAWFFHPAYAFNRHYGLHLSESYIRSPVVARLFSISGGELDGWAKVELEHSFFSTPASGPLTRLSNSMKRKLYRYIEPLFFYFG